VEDKKNTISECEVQDEALDAITGGKNRETGCKNQKTCQRCGKQFTPLGSELFCSKCIPLVQAEGVGVLL